MRTDICANCHLPHGSHRFGARSVTCWNGGHWKRMRPVHTACDKNAQELVVGDEVVADVDGRTYIIDAIGAHALHVSRGERRTVAPRFVRKVKVQGDADVLHQAYIHALDAQAAAEVSNQSVAGDGRRQPSSIDLFLALNIFDDVTHHALPTIVAALRDAVNHGHFRTEAMLLHIETLTALVQMPTAWLP